MSWWMWIIICLIIIIIVFIISLGKISKENDIAMEEFMKKEYPDIYKSNETE